MVEKSPRTDYRTWRKKHQGAIQNTALLLAILSPLGLYWALQGGSVLLAGLCAVVFIFSMLLTMEAG